MLLSNVYSLQPLESCHVSRTYHVSFRISNASLNVTYRQLFVIARNPLRTAHAMLVNITKHIYIAYICSQIITTIKPFRPTSLLAVTLPLTVFQVHGETIMKACSHKRLILPARPCNIRPASESGLGAFTPVAPNNTANDGPSLTQQSPAQRSSIVVFACHMAAIMHDGIS